MIQDWIGSKRTLTFCVLFFFFFNYLPFFSLSIYLWVCDSIFSWNVLLSQMPNEHTPPNMVSCLLALLMTPKTSYLNEDQHCRTLQEYLYFLHCTFNCVPCKVCYCVAPFTCCYRHTKKTPPSTKPWNKDVDLNGSIINSNINTKTQQKGFVINSLHSLIKLVNRPVYNGKTQQFPLLTTQPLLHIFWRKDMYDITVN